MDEEELDALDHQVAAALGGVLDGDGWRFDPPLDFIDCGHFIKTKRSFCREWAYGGPVIEREGIWLTRWPDGQWCADIPGEPGDIEKNPDPKPGEPGHVKATGWGDTPLVAAMRAVAAAIRKG